ncbi:MAG TPA: class I SAM-dependent methyltransferase [Solirubrobacteraceae bacterium]|nr:class I SAM-dependent methyltransferase [Solirubrobacteraceae bacterium]
MPRPQAPRSGQSLRSRALDARGRLPTRRWRLVPPRRLRLGADGDFVATGDEFLSHLVALCGLRPEDRVLDVGCGTGRLARPLAGFLSIDGAYAGLDANADAVAWCARRYRHLPHFRFVHADVRHARFNPGGAEDAVAYRFPFEDGSFDVAALITVLAHLTAEETLHELGQVRRVLAPGGRLLATGRFAPEREEWLLETLRAAGLDLVALHPGTWSGHPEGLSDQDVVVARA